MTSSPRKYNRRHTFFINPKFQGRFITFVIVSNFAICLAFYVGLRFFYWTHISLNKKAGFVETDILIQTLRQQEASMYLMFMAVFFLVTIGSVIVALYFSHRIAGPLYHLKKFLRDKIAGSEAEKILRFRKGDYFHELADAVNDYRDHEKSKKQPSVSS